MTIAHDESTSWSSDGGVAAYGALTLTALVLGAAAVGPVRHWAASAIASTSKQATPTMHEQPLQLPITNTQEEELEQEQQQQQHPGDEEVDELVSSASTAVVTAHHESGPPSPGVTASKPKRAKERRKRDNRARKAAQQQKFVQEYHDQHQHEQHEQQLHDSISGSVVGDEYSSGDERAPSRTESLASASTLPTSVDIESSLSALPPLMCSAATGPEPDPDIEQQPELELESMTVAQASVQGIECIAELEAELEASRTLLDVARSECAAATERAHGLEQQRQDDPEGRQDRDHRGRDQQPHQPFLDPGPGPEVDPDPRPGPACPGQRQQ